MPKLPVIHFRDIRMANNAGIAFPACYAGARLLDMDKSGLPSSSVQSEVTCQRCLKWGIPSWAKRPEDN